MEHKEDGSIFEFLHDHYSANSDHSESEEHSHHDLPFKTENCATSHNLVVVISNFILPKLNPQFVKLTLSIEYNKFLYYSNFPNNIWQPPKPIVFTA